MSWRPTATREILQLRARLLERIRAFFRERGVMEVETPALSGTATTDPALASLVTRYTGPGSPQGQTLYLHTSPEFPMKRLLAAGSGSIYQICKVFRDGEAGRQHNPEFTMLEWYREGFDHFRLMDEVDELVRKALAGFVDLGPTRKISYRDVFLEFAGINPFTVDRSGFAACAAGHGIDLAPEMRYQTDNAWCDLLMSHVIEPRLPFGVPVFVHGYPATQAALARVTAGNPPVAERFELYLNGAELANGFHELADAGEQRRRFEMQLRERRESNLPDVPPDTRLLAALEAGLPDCAGIALGFDRLVMVAAGARSIGEIIAFPIDRA